MKSGDTSADTTTGTMPHQHGLTVSRCAKRTRKETTMTRITYLGGALALCISFSAATAAQQPTAADLQMMKTWSMTFDVDKLMDKKVFITTATAYPAETPGHVYQLTIKCDGEPREFTLSTWDASGAPAGMMNGRPMAWQARTVQTGG